MTPTNGLLLLDKPKGLTSHDVVAKVRRILHEQRVGHAGTLDPMATGLLVLAVGPATRLLRFAQAEVKRYSGTVRLGVATDSLDADGAVVATGAVPIITVAQMLGATTSMLGTQLQVPPMVSAKKVGGKRLHQLAREGIEIEREPREVTVNLFEVTRTNDPELWNFEVECTVGTYVRVLLSDLCARLGTLGHLVELRRLSSGTHHVDGALTLRQLADMVDDGGEPLHPASCFVSHLESVTLSVDEERQMRQGQQLALAATMTGGEVAATDEAGDLIGVLRRRGEKWQPELVLPSSSEPADE